MPFRAAVSCSVCVAVFMLAAGSAAHAQLAAKSPFLPPQGAETKAPTVGAPLEFQGYMVTSEGAQFRIYDPARKTGRWVKLNERETMLDVIVKQHDDGQGTLTIEHQGKTLTLAERKSKIVSSGNAAQAAPPPVAPPPPSNVPAAVTQAVVLNPTPADEQKRLEAVAAEVARRRALREQATQQIGQGGAPQVMPQAVQPMQRPVQPPGNFRPQAGQVPGQPPRAP